MTQIDVTARAQRNLRLAIGTDTYEKHVSNIAWTAASQTVNWAGGTPDAQLSDSTPAVWAAAWNVVQDWQNEDSLCNFLLAHQGEQVEVAYMPDAEGTFEIVATITLVAPNIGGAVNQFNESTVSMASSVPVVTPAAAVPTTPGA